VSLPEEETTVERDQDRRLLAPPAQEILTGGSSDAPLSKTSIVLAESEPPVFEPSPVINQSPLGKVSTPESLVGASLDAVITSSLQLRVPDDDSAASDAKFHCEYVKLLGLLAVAVCFSNKDTTYSNSI
jgi:hypothetical protein